MRRFCRILWAIFAGCSLLLCAAAAGVWVRSYFVTDELSGTASAQLWTITTGRGNVMTLRLRLNLGSGWAHSVEPPRDLSAYPSHRVLDGREGGVPGFSYASGFVHNMKFGSIAIHLAYPTALFALAPLAWSAAFVRRRRRARRARIGLCEQCGYDLRASPDRCPECGAVPAR